MDLRQEFQQKTEEWAMDAQDMGMDGMEALTFTQTQATNFLLYRLLEEMKALRADLAQANEPDPDAEPDPFQTLNGSKSERRARTDMHMAINDQEFRDRNQE